MSDIRSKLFFGSVSHKRHVESAHKFRYRMFMLYLNLDELAVLAKKFKFLGIERFGFLSFWRKDYLPDMPEVSLKDAVVRKIAQQTGKQFKGSVYILTHPRWFGYVMNPLSVYYCFGPDGCLEHVVGEITNTPWRERHCYVMSPSEPNASSHTFTFAKDFHVSPFLPMAMEYTWSILTPADKLSVSVWNRVDGRLDFEAHLGLRSLPFTTRNLFRLWLLDPWITLKVICGIYWHAAVLYFIKKVHFYSHPRLSQPKEHP